MTCTVFLFFLLLFTDINSVKMSGGGRGGGEGIIVGDMTSSANVFCLMLCYIVLYKTRRHFVLPITLGKVLYKE